uniref:Uncharacterized protein n=1 Tax=Oryza meridionalis TaxID=40149 RepID=A0A0E0CHY0_9ORYZ
MVGASAIVSAARTPHAPPPRARQGSRLITPPRSPESGGRGPRRPFSIQRLNSQLVDSVAILHPPPAYIEGTLASPKSPTRLTDAGIGP